mgnify:FL=1
MPRPGSPESGRDDVRRPLLMRFRSIFVLPLKTNTLGFVPLEAMARGVPAAAYPISGPIDVVNHGVTGCLDDDLGRAIEGALKPDGDPPGLASDRVPQ